MQQTNIRENIVFIDGYCIVCNRFADFVLKADRKFRFHLATIQGATFESVRARYPELNEPPDSIIIKIGDRIFSKSTGVLKLMGMLPFPYNILKAFLLVPRVVRDPVYDLVARKRYRWFGKRESCRVPGPDDQQRFLG